MTQARGHGCSRKSRLQEARAPRATETKGVSEHDQPRPQSPMKGKIAAAIASIAFAAASAGAQTSGPDPLELGVDAGVFVGFGDNSSTRIEIPVTSARIGFPIGVRTSLEPKLKLNVTSNGDTHTDYRAELGLLYHLGSSKYPGAYHRQVCMYDRSRK